jgi:hypothetical protein
MVLPIMKDNVDCEHEWLVARLGEAAAAGSMLAQYNPAM